MEPKQSRTRLAKAVNLSQKRAAKLIVGDNEIYVWCDTFNGRLRLRVVMPDGSDLQHIRLQQVPDSV